MTITQLLSYLVGLLVVCADAEALVEHKRVIGGVPANKGNAPWLVSLTFYQRERFVTICGASIIHRRFLLTAAHCFYVPGTKRLLGPNFCNGCYWKARLASESPGVLFVEAPGIPEEDTEWYRQQQAKSMLRFFKMEEKQAAAEHKKKTTKSKTKRLGLTAEPDVFEGFVEKVIVHPKYNYDNNTNDLAVVVLSEEIPSELLSRVEILRLPTKEMTSSLPKPRENCTFAGWGCLHSGANPSNEAYILNMTVRSNEVCEAIYKRIIDTKKQICAGTLMAEHQGTCRGDSGGALVCIRNKQAFQAGVLSFGIQRREAYSPSVFTRITAYVDWVNEVIKENLVYS